MSVSINEELNNIREDLKILPHTPEILAIYEQKYNEIKQREFLYTLDSEINILLAKIEAIKVKFADRKGLLQMALIDLQKKIDVLIEKKEVFKKINIAVMSYTFQDFVASV